MVKLILVLAIASCGGKQPAPAPPTQDTTSDHPQLDGGTPPMLPKNAPVPVLDPTTSPSGPKTDL